MKAIGNSTRIFASFSRLVFCVECLFAVLFFPFVHSIGIKSYIYLPIFFVAVALSVFCMPPIYTFINNRKSLTTGKYHIPLVLSTLGLSLFTVLLFSISNSSNIQKSLILFFASFFTSCGFLVYSYVNASIEVRLFLDKPTDRPKTIFLLIGALLFVLAFIFADKYSQNVYEATATVCGIVLLASGFAVYLSTVWYMPRFIKASQPLKRGFGLTFSRFFSSFLIVENRRTYIGLFFNTLSTLILAFCISAIAEVFKVGSLITAIGLGVFFIIFCLFNFIITAKNTISSVVKTVALICSLLVVGLIFFRQNVGFEGIVNIVLFLLLPILFGVAAGINSSMQARELHEVRERSSSTPAIIVSIKNIINIVAYFVAFCLCVLLSLFKDYSLYVLLGAYGVTVVVGFCVNTVKKKYLTLEIPDEDV